MSNKRVLKELTQLRKAPPSSSNHQIISLSPVGEDIYIWEAVIAKQTPEDSPFYYHGQWKLDIRLPIQYPQVPPKVWFSKETPILHPNVDFETGEICLDILKSESWSPAWTIEYVVVAILMLIDDPEPDSPLNLDLAKLFRYDKDAFESMVQYTIWKYNTFYQENQPQSLREQSGIKVVEGVSAEDVETNRVSEATNTAMHAIQSEAEDLAEDVKNITKENHQDEMLASRINNLAHNKDPERSNIEVHDQAVHTIDVKIKELQNQKRELHMPQSTVTPASPNFDVIHEVGKQVTQQFLAKMDEINLHSPHSSEEISSHELEEIDRVKRQVTNNVTKQVNELCLRSTSPELGDIQTSQQKESEDVARIKQQFLKQVDDQMKARQGHDQLSPQLSQEESDRELQGALELSTTTNSSKQLSLSKIKRTMSLKKSKRKLFKNKQ